MKRLLSISTLYPNNNAPRFGTFVARSMEALAARGDWHVTLINPLGIPPIAFGKYRNLAAAAISGVEKGVEVYRPVFPLIPRFGVRHNPLIIARSVRKLARHLHRQQPFDVVDAQFFYPDGPAAARIASDLGLPLSIKARGSDISYWGGMAFARKQMIEAGGAATGLLAVSQALARDMAAMGMEPGKITVNYTGLDRDRFRPLDHPTIRTRLARELGLEISGPAPLLVSVGALTARKGQHFVIRSLVNFPDARLLLVGHGEDRKRLEDLAMSLKVADRVHFLGSIDHDLLPIVLSAADAMVLPSSHEGLANAWVEALACGTPLVICDAGGAREIVTSMDAGVIVERTAEGVSHGIQEVLDNPRQSAAVAAMADQFSWARNAAQLADYYTRIAAK